MNETEARIDELEKMLRHLAYSGSYQLLGFGAKGYLERVFQRRIYELKAGSMELEK